MTTPGPIPDGIAPFCDACAEGLSGVADDRARIERVRDDFCRLLGETELFARLLAEIAEGTGPVDLRRPTAFDNELLLYAHPRRLFSLRLYLYEPARFTPVHDHNSWGLLGPVGGVLEVVGYRREDDGSRPELARVAPAGRRTLRPAETASTLPLDEGIHRVGNPTDRTVASLSLYGQSLARGYIQEFDPETGRVYRILRPHEKKRMLAAQALAALGAGGAPGTGGTRP
ncbi:MAG: hypothetical protein HZB55_00400 [Deltaproteobacteria bacterium]|nr:hypothetical protein [Deltaproteobacteria bacterium]